MEGVSKGAYHEEAVLGESEGTSPAGASGFTEDT